MRRLFVDVLLLSFLTACGQDGNSDAKGAQNSGASGNNPALLQPSLVASASPAATTAVARKISVSNALIDFAYGYPAVAAMIPALKSALDSDLASRQHELEDNARTGRKDAKDGGFEFHPYGYWIDWKVVADVPGWLSLSTGVDTYEGGAHPNHGFDAMVWDKNANLRRNAIDLFVSKQKLSSVIRADFCRQIDKQRAAKRGEPINPKSGELFTECIDPADSTIILGSSNHQIFDRIGVLVAPYNAGPYVEGDYEVTLPVTPAVLAAVKPEYRTSFAIKH
jgi:hypothetical protein